MMQVKGSPIQGPTILLWSGQYFDFLNPEESLFTIQDIAHGLSNICRFGSQSHSFYSVAQHSVYVSHLVPLEHRYAALMHDAAEAFVGDVPRPLKRLLRDYREIEARVEAVIAERFRFPLEKHALIKAADNAMLAAEQIQLMRNRDGWSDTKNVQAAGIVIDPWPPLKARDEFLSRYNFLIQEGCRHA